MKSNDVLTIEDADGFKTAWPFPEGSSALRQSAYIDMCQQMHDAQRATWLAAQDDNP